MWELMFTMVFSILIVGFMMGIMPYILRKNILFGVMLPEAANERQDIQMLKRKFFWLNMGISILAALSVLAGALLNLSQEGLVLYITWVGMGAMLVNLVLALVVYLFFYNKAKAIKAADYPLAPSASSARVMVATDFRESGLKTVSTAVFAFWGILIIALTAGYTILVFDGMPDYIPRQWGFDGTVNAYTQTTLGSVLALPIVQALMLPIFLYANHIFKAAKQLIKPGSPRVSLEQNRAYRQAMSRFMVGMGLGMLLYFSILQYAILNSLENVWVFNVATLLLLVLIMFFSIRLAFKYGQGGERYKVPGSSGTDFSSQQEMVDDDAYWKWGFFYYNKKDPAFLVEKRVGMGMTFNWARWQSMAILGALLLITLLITILPMILV